VNAVWKFLAPRLRVWKEVVWRPWFAVVTSLYFVAQLYQWLKGEFVPPDVQERLRLPKILPWSWWVWLIVWVLVGLAVVLEGAYRSVTARDGKLHDQAEEAKRKALSEPTLDIIFDDKCPECWDTAGQSYARIAVWNSGSSADDVRLYLSAVKPGPNIGKLQLPWVGEGRVGTQIHNTKQRGHHHAEFMYSDRAQPFLFHVDNSASTLYKTFEPSGEYTAEVVVEARGVPTRRAKVIIRPEAHPPICAFR
jgi:hypothetical protein